MSPQRSSSILQSEWPWSHYARSRLSGRPNKGMKLTSVERIGRSQLIPGVGRTLRLPVRRA